MTFRRTLRLRLAALTAVALALVAAGAATAATSVARDVSSNWAGYVVSGTTFSSVTGTWVQPAIDCTSTGTSASAFWVGLGGNTDGSNALEQAGTGAECKADGTASYYAWYELVPAPSIDIALAIEPGDTITATVTVAGTKVTLQVTNVTTGKSVAKVKRMAAPDVSSAEWVAEAPSLCSSSGYCRTVTLSDFGKVRFTKATATSADGHTGSISDRAWTATWIQLVADSGGPGYGRYAAYDTPASATPTALTSRGTAFAVKWQGTSGAAVAAAPPTPPGYYGF
jgi:Peptidase A4 family